MNNTFYLSDQAHAWFKTNAAREGVSQGAYVEKHYPEWVMDLHVDIKDSSVRELIAVRRETIQRETSDSALERGDKPRRKYAAAPMYDGVVWIAMFGAWQRTARNYDVSGDCIRALAAWVQREGVVQRRAATPNMLASQTLELIGRGWTTTGAVAQGVVAKAS